MNLQNIAVNITECLLQSSLDISELCGTGKCVALYQNPCIELFLISELDCI